MKFYIIPGYGESAREYRWLIFHTRKKYEVEFLNLQLKNNSLRALSNTPIQPHSIVFGFSTGALIAYKLKTPVEKGIYCSPATLLGKDTKGKIQHLRTLFGKRTADELQSMRYGKPKAKKYIVFCGDKELDERILQMDHLQIIKNTGHKFTKRYKETILKTIQ